MVLSADDYTVTWAKQVNNSYPKHCKVAHIDSYGDHGGVVSLAVALVCGDRDSVDGVVETYVITLDRDGNWSGGDDLLLEVATGRFVCSGSTTGANLEQQGLAIGDGEPVDTILPNAMTWGDTVSKTYSVATAVKGAYSLSKEATAPPECQSYYLGGNVTLDVSDVAAFKLDCQFMSADDQDLPKGLALSTSLPGKTVGLVTCFDDWTGEENKVVSFDLPVQCSDYAWTSSVAITLNLTPEKEDPNGSQSESKEQKKSQSNPQRSGSNERNDQFVIESTDHSQKLLPKMDDGTISTSDDRILSTAESSVTLVFSTFSAFVFVFFC